MFVATGYSFCITISVTFAADMLRPRDFGLSHSRTTFFEGAEFFMFITIAFFELNIPFFKTSIFYLRAYFNVFS